MSEAVGRTRWRARFAAALMILALGLAPLWAEYTGQGYLISVMTRIAIYGLAAVSLDFVLGFAGLVSLAHAAFFGIGAYVTAILSFHAYEETPVVAGISGTNEAFIAWPLAMVAAGLFAALVGWVSLRTRGVYFIMITLAFGQMLFYFALSLEAYGGDDGMSLWWGPNALPGLDLSDRLSYFYVCFGLLIATLVLFARLVRSRFGLALRAGRDNEQRLRAVGINPFPIRLAAFALSGAVCGLAGALLVNQAEFVSPDVLRWTRSGELLIMVILGGMGSLIGPVAGAALLLFAEETLISFTEHWQVLLGPILIVVVLFARGGLWGAITGGARDR